MQTALDFQQLEPEVREIACLVYADTLRQLNESGYSAASPANRSETGIQLCWRIMELARRGVSDPHQLRAYALASIDERLMQLQLEAARLNFEAKVLVHQRIKARCVRDKLSRSSLREVLLLACTEEAEAKTRYTELLLLLCDSR